jgi:dTDP-4-dehydrorhamnose reductase
MEKTRTLLIGASGLVGNEIFECISKENQDIFLLSRRTADKDQNKFKEIITEFDDLDEINLPRIDHVYIAIGKKLSSSELLYISKSDRDNFIRVDCEYVLKIAKKAFDNGARSIAIVSAIGADKNSYNLYLKTKGNMENLIKKIGYSKTIFAQPSHLLGKRVNESFKLDVSLIELGGKIFSPLMLGPFSDFKFVEARDVAKAMVQKMNDDSSGLTILRYKDFVNI